MDLSTLEQRNLLENIERGADALERIAHALEELTHQPDGTMEHILTALNGINNSIANR